MSVTITGPSGSRSVDAFRVRRDESPRELQGQRAKGSTRVVAYGDKGKRPTPLVIEVEVQESSLSATATEAAAILSDAEDATSVETPRGTRSVNGLLWTEQSRQGPAEVLTLAFAPTGGDYS